MSTRRWIFHSPSLLERHSYQSSSRILRLHCTSWTNWNYREVVEVTRRYFFKWRFSCRCRRRCLSSLLALDSLYSSLLKCTPVLYQLCLYKTNHVFPFPTDACSTTVSCQTNPIIHYFVATNTEVFLHGLWLQVYAGKADLSKGHWNPKRNWG